MIEDPEGMIYMTLVDVSLVGIRVVLTFSWDKLVAIGPPGNWS